MTEPDDPTEPQSSPLERMLDKYWADRRAGKAEDPGNYLRMLSDPAGKTIASAAESAAGANYQSLGPYRLIEQLGRGGQGVVYLAEDPRLGRKVALKVLTLRGPQATEHFERFRREAHMASKLDHPGICAVYDTGVEDGTPYIAMRHVEGEPLSQRIFKATQATLHTLAESSRCGPLSELFHSADFIEKVAELSPVTSADSLPIPRGPDRKELETVLRLIESCARALHAAHESGIVHRDIKPGNIMVGPNDQPVILDFGLARDDESEFVTLTRTGDLFGTPAYMSPEQIQAMSRGLDRRTDVWSLGVALWECLALERPFQGATRQSLHHEVLNSDPPNIRRLNPAVGPDLKVVIETALEKDRERRYPTAEAFADELQRCREQRPITARPAGPKVRLQRWVQRNPKFALMTLGTLLALILGLGFSVWGFTEANQNLKKYERLADGATAKRLVQSFGQLYPATPRKVFGDFGMNAWIQQAELLVRDLPHYEAELNDLESRAHPWTEAERLADRAQLLSDHPSLARELEILRIQASAGASEGSGEDLGPESRAPATRDEAMASIAALESRLQELGLRRTWRFAKDRDVVLHSLLRPLVQNSKELQRMLPELRERRADALALHQRSVIDHEDLWLATIESIRRDPIYSGLVIEPITGLVPLGKDPHSGFQEFAHMPSGTIPRRHAKTHQLEVTSNTGAVFVLLPEAKALIGAQRKNPKAPGYDPYSRLEKERPPHFVPLSHYFISKFELNQGQYLRLTGTNPSGYQPGSHEKLPVTLDHPVENISWIDATDLMNKLGWNLPTEAQWEHAARGGTHGPWWCVPQDKNPAKVPGLDRLVFEANGNVQDFSFSKHFGPRDPTPVEDGFAIHSPVQVKTPNPYGLYGTIGNVAEWCRDTYGPYTAPTAAHTGERLVLNAIQRVFRGGNFQWPGWRSRHAHRVEMSPRFSGSTIGLRPVINLH